MKTRFFPLLFALIASVGTVKASVEIDGISYNLNGTAFTAQIISANKQKTGELIIPSQVTYEGTIYNVTSIGDYAFTSCSGLTSIEIPNSIISIGQAAFVGCSGLTKITIGSGVTDFGKNTFCNCTSLKSVVWNAKSCNNFSTSTPFYNDRGEDPVFDVSSQITSFTFGEEVERIPRGLCSYMRNLTSIIIPNSVTSIGSRAFYRCEGLTRVHGSDITTWCNITFEGRDANPLSYAHQLYINGTQVSNVIIPNCCTSIGNYVFEGCSGLTSVTIPNRVTSIGTYAFKDCTGLTNINLPNSVTSIGSYAFSGCYDLTSINIPNDVTSIGNHVFEGCAGLTSVTIPNRVTSIGTYAFKDCIGLTNINLPNSVTNIESYAFAGCIGLTSINIPNSVISIGVHAFEGCTGLTNVDIPNSISSLESYTFASCTGLTSVAIPNSVTSIGNYAFEHCYSLTSVTIPNSVTSVGSSAFYECSNLKDVHISDLATWCNITFDGSGANPLYYAHHLYLNDTEITDLVIPNNVTSVGRWAFSGCSGLTSIKIPNSVDSIANYAFESCSGLTSIVVETGNSVYDSRNDCNAIIETASNTLITGCKNTIIPDGITSIGTYAFAGCSGLTNIEIPTCVTSIRNYAFSNCTGLTSVTIPASVDSIGYGAFNCCTGLTNVTIPNDVTSIGGEAFYWVPNIVYYGEATGSPWGARSMNGYIDGWLIYSDNTKTNLLVCLPEAIGTIEIPNSVTSIGDYAFWGCSGLTSVTIPNSVTNIGGYAFVESSGLTSIVVESGNSVYDSRNNCNAIIETASNTLIAGCQNTIIPDGITSIGTYAFAGCYGLTNITIPNSVTSIMNGAFGWCSALTSIEIPTSVTSIEKMAFEYCVSLTSVTWNAKNCPNRSGGSLFGNQVTSFIFGNKVENIPACCCEYMNKLTSIIIPANVTSIGYLAFYGCTGLTSLTIPNSVTSIGDDAFSGCSSLTNIICGSTNPPVCADETFYKVKKSIPLYVPAESIELYKAAKVWNEFTNIFPFQAADVNVTDVIVEPTDNGAIIQWPMINGAYTYELVIKDKNGDIICTLIFNEQGQLLSIAFNAPKRNNAPQQTQTAGFAFTVTGLDSGTRYTATIAAKASNGSVLNTKTVSFTTTGQPQAINNVCGETKIDSKKIVRNGQLLIQQGDKIYNAQGARVR